MEETATEDSIIAFVPKHNNQTLWEEKYIPTKCPDMIMILGLENIQQVAYLKRDK